MRFSAHLQLHIMQLTVLLGWLLLSASVIAQENSEIPPEWLFSDETVDLAEEDDGTPRFVVPPDPKTPTWMPLIGSKRTTGLTRQNYLTYISVLVKNC